MHEYKVVPAPQRTAKIKGLKTTAERFAHLLEESLNAGALDGWEFLRAETLPCEERKGLTGFTKSFQSVLVFRRAVGAPDKGHQPVDEIGADGDTAQDLVPDIATPDSGETGPRLSLVATRHEPETPATRSDQPCSPPAGRQEPVLRPGAPLAALASERPEPVLRTRALDELDENER